MFARTSSTTDPLPPAAPPAADAPAKGALKPASEQVATTAQASITAALTFLIGSLAFLGIVGDGLERLIRNDPNLFLVAIALGLIGAVVPLADGFVKNRMGASATIGSAVIQFAGTAFLVAATIVTLVWGAHNLSLRDQPHVELTTTATTTGVLIAAEAKTSSMLAGEKMLLMVATIDDGAASDATGARLLCTDEFDAFTNPAVSVLYWAETAPTTAGNAADQFQREVADADAGYACASVFLLARPSDCKQGSSPQKDVTAPCAKLVHYNAVSVIDLTTAAPSVPVTGSTSPSASPSPSSSAGG